MPRFIGHTIDGATLIEDNARETHDRVRLSYAQAKLLPPAAILVSLDTTDRGSKGSRAKRWYRWFAPPHVILQSARATPKMRAHALLAAEKAVARDQSLERGA